jgi:hypothetical protein
MLASKLEGAWRDEAKQRQAQGGKAKVVQNSAQGKTRDRIAEAAGVSHDTVHKARYIRENADDEAKLAAV